MPVVKIFPLILILPLKLPIKFCVIGMNGHELGNGLSVFGDQNTIRVYSIE